MFLSILEHIVVQNQDYVKAVYNIIIDTQEAFYKN